MEVPAVADHRPRLLRESAKYFAIFRIELRQLTAYTWDFVLANLTVVITFFVLLQVWRVTVHASHVGSLGGEGFTWTQLVWFLAAGQTLYFSVRTEAQLDIEHDVISGNIAVTLARPYDYLLSRFASVMAYSVLSFGVTFPIAIAMAWSASGEFAVGPVGILAFVVAFLIRTVLYFALQAIAGLLTFWIEKATAFVWILGLLILIFGGGAVPLGYWPAWARTAVEFTPFPVLMYWPSRLFVQPDPAAIVSTLLRSAIWLLVLGAIVRLIYARALRRLDLNGG